MSTKRAAPPVFGLFLLAAVAGGVAYAAVSQPDPLEQVDLAPKATAFATRQEVPVGAEASRMAEFMQRDIRNNA